MTARSRSGVGRTGGEENHGQGGSRIERNVHGGRNDRDRRKCRNSTVENRGEDETRRNGKVRQLVEQVLRIESEDGSFLFARRCASSSSSHVDRNWRSERTPISTRIPWTVPLPTRISTIIAKVRPNASPHRCTLVRICRETEQVDHGHLEQDETRAFASGQSAESFSASRHRSIRYVGERLTGKRRATSR